LSQSELPKFWKGDLEPSALVDFGGVAGVDQCEAVYLSVYHVLCLEDVPDSGKSVVALGEHRFFEGETTDEAV
jgi:hypothetical protein